jgi:hypothetical protein
MSPIPEGTRGQGCKADQAGAGMTGLIRSCSAAAVATPAVTAAATATMAAAEAAAVAVCRGTRTAEIVTNGHGSDPIVAGVVI